MDLQPNYEYCPPAPTSAPYPHENGESSFRVELGGMTSTNLNGLPDFAHLPRLAFEQRQAQICPNRSLDPWLEIFWSDPTFKQPAQHQGHDFSGSSHRPPTLSSPNDHGHAQFGRGGSFEETKIQMTACATGAHFTGRHPVIPEVRPLPKDGNDNPLETTLENTCTCVSRFAAAKAGAPLDEGEGYFTLALPCKISNTSRRPPKSTGKENMQPGDVQHWGNVRIFDLDERDLKMDDIDELINRCLSDTDTILEVSGIVLFGCIFTYLLTPEPGPF
jgi:hypothetical protein